MALTDNLVSYWKLDESSGNASDSISSYTLTNVGTTPYTTGKINNCADMNGSSQYFTKGSHLSEIEGGSYSISLWVSADAGQSGTVYPEVLSQDQIGSRGMWFRFDNGMKLQWLQFFGGDNRNITVTDNLSTATWYHFVMVYEEVGAGTSKMTLYQNGSSTGTPVTDAPINPNSTTAKFMVGAWAVTDGSTIQDWFNGRVDEIGVWNRALSSTEVTALYNSGNGLAYPFSTSAIKSINGLVKSSVKSVNGLALASVKKVNGLA